MNYELRIWNGNKKYENIEEKKIIKPYSLFFLIPILFSLFLIPYSVNATTESIAIIREDCSQASDPALNCYNSLSAWEAAENRDLVASDEIAIAQIEGSWANPDTTAVTIGGWTTSATNYIKIYTTATARHNGKWDTRAYRLEVNDDALNILEANVRIDGLEIDISPSVSGEWREGINIPWANTDVDEIYISHNIIKNSNPTDNNSGIGINPNDGGNIFYVWNNIVYNFTGAGSEGVIFKNNTYLYNNTIYNCNVGVRIGTITVTAKNNIVKNCVDGFSGTFDSSSDYNISDIDTDAPNATFTGGYATVSFQDSANNDFHLSSTDTSALDQGTDLSADANLAFTTDIDGDTRPIDANWDIGADETAGTASSDTQAPTIPANLTATAISSSQINLSWDASTDNVGVTGYNIYRCAGSGCTPTTIITTTTGITFNDTGLTESTTYNYTVSAYDAVPNDSSQTSPVSATTQAPAPDTTPPAISNGSPSGSLSSGTTSTTLSVTTDENATCKYDTTSGTAYASMANTFSTTGGTSHSTTITGLTDGTSYNYYVKCQDAGGYANLTDYTISFSVNSAPTGNVYYVSSTGTASWAECADINTPCSLATANSSAIAGDTIYLRGGTYGTKINPTNSGTSGNMITYQAYTGETPIITPSGQWDIAITLTGDDYIKIDGLTIQDAYGWASIRAGSDYNEIVNCIFTDTDGAMPATALKIWGQCAAGSPYNCPSTNNWVHNNTMYRSGSVGAAPVCDDGGGVIYIGTITDGDSTSNYNTIEDNVMYAGGHHVFEIDTRYNVVRNNVMHNEGWMTDPGGCNWGPSPRNGKYGNRNIQLFNQDSADRQFTLLENNRIGHAAFAPDGGMDGNIVIASRANIVRYNYAYYSETIGIYFKDGTGPADAMDNRVYNNTVYSSGQDSMAYPDAWTGYGEQDWRRGVFLLKDILTGNVVKNNIVYNSFTIDIACNATCQSNNTFTDNWITTDGDPLFINPDVSDPTSTTLPDLRVKPGSGVINKGVYLTQTNGSGINSTTLIVDDALYFQDGLRGSSLSNIQADWIAIGTVSNTAQINSIDYDTNTITLEAPITWSDNANIWLYKDSSGNIVLSGTAPDIGAYEYIDSSITYQCNDTIDNDSDGLTDYPDDLGCSFTTDNDETDPIDTTPPATITDLSATEITQTSVSLVSWTSPGDDGSVGTASLYDIRYSTSSLSDSIWNSAVQATGEPTPSVAGTTESYTLVGLTPNTTYYAAIKTSDEANNVSGISNIVSFATLETEQAPIPGCTDSSATNYNSSANENDGTCSYPSTDSTGSPQTNSGSPSGGSYFDSTPPSQPDDFKAQGANEQITLTWVNPTDTDFVRVLIARKEGSVPVSRADGETVYEGIDQEYTDVNLDNNMTYYYAIYSYDKKPNYSQSVIVSAQPEAGKTSIELPKASEEEKETISISIFTKLLYYGMKDEQVRKLQEFLSQDKDIYPEGLITGYYGSLTQKAVQRFQNKYNIVSSGTPQTTGYGLAGPRTREKLNELYSGISNSQFLISNQIPISKPQISKDKEILIQQVKEMIEQLQQKLVQLLAELVKVLQEQLMGQ